MGWVCWKECAAEVSSKECTLPSFCEERLRSQFNYESIEIVVGMVRQEECALYRMPILVTIAGRSLVRRYLYKCVLLLMMGVQVLLGGEKAGTAVNGLLVCLHATCLGIGGW